MDKRDIANKHIKESIIKINKLLEDINKEAMPYIDDWEFEVETNKLYVGKKVASRSDILQLKVTLKEESKKDEAMPLEELESYEPKNSIEEEYYDELWR